MTTEMPAEYKLTFAGAASLVGQDAGAMTVAQAIHGANFGAALLAAFQSVDQDRHFATERAKLSARAWDGAELINGVEPEAVRAAHGIGAGTGAYLIEQDGQVMIFQPVPGETNLSVLSTQAQGHADQLAATRAHERIVNAITEALLEV